VDIGGGTSEMGVTALGSLVVEHSIRVGGYELDDAIVRLLQNEAKLLVGQEQADALKIEIGSALPVADRPDLAQVAGRDLVSVLLRRIDVYTEQVQAALAARSR
jgi:rod shape-determining protein MreB and related proteins